MFQTELYRKSKPTFCVQCLFSENRAVDEVMWKNIVEPEWSHNSAHVLCMLVN